jgi:CO dehydrogenase nickel-insertion accessory protein CooC1
VGKIYLIVNRVSGELSLEIRKAIDEQGLELIATIPEDPHAANLEARGTPITELPSDSPLKIAIKEIAGKIGLYVTA